MPRKRPAAVCYATGGTYEGEWKDGKEHGKGKYVSADGAVYEGQWELGKWHGEGRFQYANGDVYVGQYNKGEIHNVRGKFTSADGNIYDGQWVNGQFHGAGKYAYAVRWEQAEYPPLEVDTRVRDEEIGMGTIVEYDSKKEEFKVAWDDPSKKRTGDRKRRNDLMKDGVERELEAKEFDRVCAPLPIGQVVKNRNIKNHTEKDVGTIVDGDWQEEGSEKYAIQWKKESKKADVETRKEEKKQEAIEEKKDEENERKEKEEEKGEVERGITIEQILIRAGGEIYEGQWKDGQQNGTQKYTDTYGNEHPGIYKDGDWVRYDYTTSSTNIVPR